MCNSHYREQNFHCNRQNCLQRFSLLKIIKRLFFFFKSDPFVIKCHRCGHINVFYTRKINLENVEIR